jgi:hypothetical protein
MLKVERERERERETETMCHSIVHPTITIESMSNEVQSSASTYRVRFLTQFIQKNKIKLFLVQL